MLQQSKVLRHYKDQCRDHSPAKDVRTLRNSPPLENWVYAAREAKIRYAKQLLKSDSKLSQSWNSTQPEHKCVLHHSALSISSLCFCLLYFFLQQLYFPMRLVQSPRHVYCYFPASILYETPSLSCSRAVIWRMRIGAFQEAVYCAVLSWDCNAAESA